MGVLDGSHDNWDSDNLIITALIKLKMARDVFFGSWELGEDGCVPRVCWCYWGWSGLAPTGWSSGCVPARLARTAPRPQQCHACFDKGMQCLQHS